MEGVAVRHGFSALLVLALVAAQMPIFGSVAAAHAVYAPIQPIAYPGYGSTWWNHWADQLYVAVDVGTVECQPGTTCELSGYDGDRYSIGVVFWHDTTCYGDGCGSVNLEMWRNGAKLSENGINNSVLGSDADNSANNGSYYFPPFNCCGGRFLAAVFTYCKWALLDVNRNVAGCSRNGEAGRVRTSQLDGLHFQWRFVSGDGSNGAFTGDAFTTTSPPPGYPAPGVPNDRANYPRRCAVPGTICSVFCTRG